MRILPRPVSQKTPPTHRFKTPVRLLPIVIFFAALMLSVRTNELVGGLNLLFGSINVPESHAQAEDEAPPPENGADTDGETSTENNQPPTDIFRDLPKTEFSEAEIKTLQNLSARRDELDIREKSLETREGLLVAAEERIDAKIAELTALEKQIKSLIIQYDEQEEARLRSLVKIYENMKPKDAARIFNELDMDILLDVVDLMNERRVAPVLAKMDPAKAQKITSELALQSFIPRDAKTLGAMLEKQENRQIQEQ